MKIKIKYPSWKDIKIKRWSFLKNVTQIVGFFIFMNILFSFFHTSEAKSEEAALEAAKRMQQISENLTNLKKQIEIFPSTCECDPKTKTCEFYYGVPSGVDPDQNITIDFTKCKNYPGASK